MRYSILVGLMLTATQVMAQQSRTTYLLQAQANNGSVSMYSGLQEVPVLLPNNNGTWICYTLMPQGSVGAGFICTSGYAGQLASIVITATCNAGKKADAQFVSLFYEVNNQPVRLVTLVAACSFN